MSTTETPSAPLAASEISPEQLAEAKEYSWRSLQLSLVDLGLDFVFLTVFAFFLARPLDDWLARFPLLHGDDLAARLVRLPAFVAIYFVLHVAVSIWLSYYRGYVLEHQFNLSNQTRGRWLTQQIKKLALVLVANIVLLVGLYAILWLCGWWWWIAAAGAAFVVTVLLGMIAPVLILPLFVKYEPLKDETLQAELAKLAEGTGLSIEGTYRLLLSADTKKANAMLAGMGRTRRVLLGDTLLDNFTHDEIKVVMAHELGHHVFGHIRKMVLLAIPYTLVTFFLCDLALRFWIQANGQTYNPAQMPVYAVSMLMLLTFVLSFCTGPLQNALMRHFERQCDRYALDRTGLAAAYRTAFTKLAVLNKADPDPHWLEVLLFDDHPPIRQRLAMADE